MKSPHPTNDNHIDQTRQVWQPRLGRNLSRENARQIAQNVTGFFTVLSEWSRAEVPSPANNTGKATPPKNWRPTMTPESLSKPGGGDVRDRRVRVARPPLGLDFNDLLTRCLSRSVGGVS